MGWLFTFKILYYFRMLERKNIYNSGVFNMNYEVNKLVFLEDQDQLLRQGENQFNPPFNP